MLKVIRKAQANVRAESAAVRGKANTPKTTATTEEEAEEESTWESQALHRLPETAPGPFEERVMELLRRLGFVEIEHTEEQVTQGIDLRAIYRPSERLGFPMAVQCKRYSSAIGPKQMREFRGALGQGVERGVFVTTSSFTRAAIDEARKKENQPIERVDGPRLLELLKEQGMGSRIRTIEVEELDEEFFRKYT